MTARAPADDDDATERLEEIGSFLALRKNNEFAALVLGRFLCEELGVVDR